MQYEGLAMVLTIDQESENHICTCYQLRERGDISGCTIIIAEMNPIIRHMIALNKGLECGMSHTPCMQPAS